MSQDTWADLWTRWTSALGYIPYAHVEPARNWKRSDGLSRHTPNCACGRVPALSEIERVDHSHPYRTGTTRFYGWVETVTAFFPRCPNCGERVCWSVSWEQGCRPDWSPAPVAEKEPK